MGSWRNIMRPGEIFSSPAKFMGLWQNFRRPWRNFRRPWRNFQQPSEIYGALAKCSEAWRNFRRPWRNLPDRLAKPSGEIYKMSGEILYRVRKCNTLQQFCDFRRSGESIYSELCKGVQSRSVPRRMTILPWASEDFATGTLGLAKFPKV